MIAIKSKCTLRDFHRVAAMVIIGLALAMLLRAGENDKKNGQPETGRILNGRLVEAETNKPLGIYDLGGAPKTEEIHVLWIVGPNEEVKAGPQIPLGADGRFRIEGAPAGARKIQIRSDYSLSAIADIPTNAGPGAGAGGGQIDLGDVRISRGVTATGRFIRAENRQPLSVKDLADRFGRLLVSFPQAGTAYEKDADNHFLSLENGGAQRTGCFAVIRIPPQTGKISLMALRSAIAEIALPKEAPGNRANLGDVEIAMGYKVEGRLVDDETTAPASVNAESGMKHVIGAEVVATLANSERTRLNYIFNTRGAGGRFELWDAPKDTRKLTFYPRNYLPREAGPISLDSMDTSGAVNLGEIRLRRGERLSGKIMEADGTPLQGLTVLVAGAPGDAPPLPLPQDVKDAPDSLSALMPAGAHAHWAVLNKQGEFIVQGLYPGKARLLGRFPARREAAEAAAAAAPDPRLVDKEVMITSGADNRVEIILPR
ncbi:MAG: hypothetical protein NTX50_18345 [Candidatus Sumerlaeota bacterium]|nr:hypothetical protein [Candidatus Sumerlaeota bacterium]